jgi:heme exporter protein D
MADATTPLNVHPVKVIGSTLAVKMKHVLSHKAVVRQVQQPLSRKATMRNMPKLNL